MFDRSALIGRASNWSNWAVQFAVFGLGALAYHLQGMAFSWLVLFVVFVSLTEGATALARQSIHEKA